VWTLRAKRAQAAALVASQWRAKGGQDRVGWTVGTGIEWGLWQNWSGKAEYDYIDFGTKTTPITGTVLPGIATFPASIGLEDNLRIQQVKVGVNYRFLPNLW
jgi:opacity protein-like surface antigen